MTTLKLRDYQKRGVDFAINNKSTFMILDVGLGKTAISLNTIAKLGMSAYVFAPLRVATIVWPDEIRKWTPNLTFTVLHGPSKNRRFHTERDIYLISYSNIKWFFEKVIEDSKYLKNCILILDESSMIRNPSTKRFKYFKLLTEAFSDYKMNLSATPSPNGLHELWSQYYVLDQGDRLEYSYYKYRDKYFDYIGPPIYKTTIKPWRDKVIAEKVADITYRLDAKDYLELPPIIYNQVNLNMPTKVREAYEKLEKDFFVKFGSEEISAFSAAALSMKLRQFLQGAVYTVNPKYKVIHEIKVKALEELIEIHEGQPILCAIQFRFEYDMIAKKLGEVPLIAGGVSASKSATHVRRWNAGKIPLLICHPGSIAHGMNLQAGGSVILWYGLTWSLEQYKQLNGRLHRHGQQNAVVVNHLIFRDTMDEIVLKTLSKKFKTQEQFLNELRENLTLERSTVGK